MQHAKVTDIQGDCDAVFQYVKELQPSQSKDVSSIIPPPANVREDLNVDREADQSIYNDEVKVILPTFDYRTMMKE
ncbi:hypothetical protein T265_00476 [Opisthorchis viverrini]|uniref:Uncharacterized protein n=1 Tax=Opisthorchis viverrini TaxID=6198 RepID=A0A075A276_OPIVI|nr:hypothetical protein T265_00476 [Opisthorchis viverrini]KER33818.1 hypothetical protein T265_00476 [Opisthorchis viverrini]